MEKPMTTLAFEKLNTLTFRAVVGLIPICFLLHELEEWYILDWYNRFYIDMPDSTNLSVRLWILFISMVGFLLTGLTLLPKSSKITAYLIVPLIVLTIANGLQHVFWIFYFKAYAPGAFFGGLIGVSLGLYIVIRAIGEKLIPFWYPMLFIPYLTKVLISTVEAGNTLSPSIRAIHEFGIRMAMFFLRF